MDPNCWFPSATSVSLTLCLLPPPLPLLPLTRSPATYSLTHLLSPFFTMFLFSLPSILSQRHLFFFSFCPLSSPPASSHLLIPLCPSLLLILLALTLPKYNYLYLDYYGWSIWWIIQWDNRHVNCQRFFCTVYTEVTSLWYLRGVFCINMMKNNDFCPKQTNQSDILSINTLTLEFYLSCVQFLVFYKIFIWVAWALS